MSTSKSASSAEHLADRQKPVSIEGLQSEITQLGDKVHSIAERNQASKKPWFKDIATVISLAAFLFSFGTTIVSYKRANDEDIHNLKSELRGILQRLAALPKENIEIKRKYSSDPSAIVEISGYLNQENLLLSKQADAIIRRLPKTQVSSTDYSAVALALELSREFPAAVSNFKSALAVASTLDDEIGALRPLAALEMALGKSGDARAHFQQALDLFGSKYPAYDNVTRNSTNCLTELNWASAEAGQHNMEGAAQHLNSAEQLVKNLPERPETKLLQQELSQARSALFALTQAKSTNTLPVPISGQITALAPPPAPRLR